MNMKMVRPLLASLASLLLLTACSLGDRRDNGNVPDAVSEDISTQFVIYTVQPGDKLSTIALETTGVSQNWQAIAAHNSISDPRKLQVGVELEIPAIMISGSVNDSTPVIDTTPANGTTEVASLSTVQRQEPSMDNEIAPVKVVVTPIENVPAFKLNPIEIPASNSTQEVQTGEAAVNQRIIKIVGTYYPKGVYAQPAAYAELMMRVAPGSTFVLDRTIDDWYRIETDQGTGYLRASDGEIIDPSATDSVANADDRQ